MAERADVAFELGGGEGALRSAVLRVCVAIPTFRRPESLRSLLEAIALQSVSAGYAVDVLVMDNDRRPSAQAIVDELRAAFPFRLDYAHVAEPGLSVVRNFAISWARKDYDYLVMVDDDEVPVTEWLRELLRVRASAGADIVIGPVPHVVPPDAPRWIRAGTFYEVVTYEDEEPMRDGYSGNCLLDLVSLERFDVRFDHALNLAGGEDMLFFRELLSRGAKMVYAAGAIAVEVVTPGRLRLDYLLKLNYRRGNTLSICDRHLGRSGGVLVRRALKASARLGLGLATFVPLFVLRGRTGAVAALCNVAQGLGGLVGLRGHIYQAYSRAGEETTHGTR